MGVGVQEPEIEVEFPESWEDEVDEGLMQDIQIINEKVNQDFQEIGLANDLSKIRIEDSGEVPGSYCHREHERNSITDGAIQVEKNREDVALMDISRNNLHRDYIKTDSQHQTFSHELAHDFFWKVIATQDRRQYEEMNNLFRESEVVIRTLDEAFADLTMWTYTEEKQSHINRNPFTADDREAYQGLGKAFSINNRKQELKHLNGILEDIEDNNYSSAMERIDEIHQIVPDVDFNKYGVEGNPRDNIFLSDMEEFFSTSRKCTSNNEKEIQLCLQDLVEDPEARVTRFTHGRYDCLEVEQKAEKHCENPEIEAEVAEKSEDILRDVIEDWVSPTIDQVKRQLKTVRSEDVGDYILEGLNYSKYGSSNNVDEDADFPHEVGGVLAEVLHSEYNLTPMDVAENPLEYAEVVEESIKETIRYGVELTSPDNDLEWDDADLDEYKQRLSGIVEDYDIP